MNKTHRKPLSRNFPAYHPKAGQPTYFVEKLWTSIFFGQEKLTGWEPSQWLDDKASMFESELANFYDYSKKNIVPYNAEKSHTIRAGNKVQVGDFIQFYSWIGKPYGKGSTTVNIAPEIEVKSVWAFDISNRYSKIYLDGKIVTDVLGAQIAENDGLSLKDMLHWFKYPKQFEGQIICWNDKIEY